MSQQKEQKDQWHESLTKGYEPGRMRVRWFVVAVVGFVGFAAVTHVLLWYLVKADAHPRPGVDRATSVVAGQYRAPGQAPPLQPTPDHDRVPKEDLEAMYRGEDEVFAALGWQVDRQSHRVVPPEQLVRLVGDRYPLPRSAGPTTGSDRRLPASRITTPIPGVDQGGKP